MKPNFNQIAACIMFVLLFAGMMFIYFFPQEGINASSIIAGITGNFGACIIFLLKSGSDAKNEKQMSEMIDALKNSTPTNQP